MSAIIREIFWQEYDTTTQIRTVRADIICDAIADLPSGGIMTDYKLDIGSRAKVISDGSEWEIQSSGSWVRQPSRMQLDLTGYATESWVNGELAGYVPTTTYSTDQAAQDAKINPSYEFIFGLGTALSANDDLNNYNVVGKIYAATGAIASTIANTPWTLSGFMVITIPHITSSTFIQFLLPNTSGGKWYKRRYTTGTWAAWTEYDGIQV